MLTPAQALTIGLIVAPLLLALSMYFTRASARRALGGLAGAAAFGLGNLVWDRAAAAQGWWSYPFTATWRDFVPFYILSGIVAGGAFGLIGWRLTRRYGGCGLAVFLLVWGIWGVIHDYGGVAAFQASNLMRFSPGVMPVIADFLLYVTCGAFAQLVIRLVAGPAKAGPLARSSQSAEANR